MIKKDFPAINLTLVAIDLPGKSLSRFIPNKLILNVA